VPDSQLLPSQPSQEVYYAEKVYRIVTFSLICVSSVSDQE